MKSSVGEVADSALAIDQKIQVDRYKGSSLH